MLLEEFKYVVQGKKIRKCIIGDINSSSDSDKEAFDEESCDEENSD